VSGPLPTPAFGRVDLDITTVDPSQTFGRIHRKAYPEPLGFGKTASRFSDPRRRVPDNRFGVLYLGSTLKVCFAEAVLRDQRDGHVGDIEIAEAELDDRFYSEVTIHQPLHLVNLAGDGPIRMGIPSDVVRGRTHTLARKWSLALYDHRAAVDGLLYPSRLNNQINLALYDRAISKLRPTRTLDLTAAPGIGRVLDDFLVALI
jgi:hypothetical protein